MRIYFFFIFLALTLSCRESEVQVADPVNSDLHIKMERGGCYGRCPIYVLEISSDGNVTFDGKFFTKVNGRAQARISPQRIDDIVAAIKATDFFSFEDSYEWESGNCPALATDLSTVVLYVKLGDRQKTIKHYHGCFQDSEDDTAGSFDEQIFPQKLYRLELQIDELAESGKWAQEDEIE
jgi:hypothetical protein